MLKQWFIGRKKKSSGYRFRTSALGKLRKQQLLQQQRHQTHLFGTNFPLADSYLVYRRNPAYIEDGNGSVRALHVSQWCTLVCPFHLNAACACKPSVIYCDSCQQHPSEHCRSLKHNYQNLNKMLPPTTTVDNIYQVVERPSEVEVVKDAGPLDHFFVTQKPVLAVNNSKNVIHIYMNSDFVSQIGVPNAVQVQSDDYVSSVRREASDETLLDVVSFVSEESDSLESLHIDERLFAINGQSDGEETQAVAIEVDVKVRENVHDDGHGGVEALQDEVDERISAYDAVKDLYEKLSNCRERQVVVQAVSSTSNSASDSVGRLSGRKFKTFVGNTYETLTKHVRNSYAKLVEEDANIYQNDSSSGSTSGIFHITIRNVNSPALNLLSMPSTSVDDRPQLGPPTESITVLRGEDLTSQIDQFITKRDPKYGPQVGQRKSSADNKRKMCHNIRKLLRQKQYRDALKIIVTTLIGFTAFGIITALSLSINRP